MNVHDQDHSQAGQQPADRSPSQGGRGGGSEPGTRLLLREAGGGGDHQRRRFDLEFRDERRTCTVIGGGPTASNATSAGLERFPAIAVNDGYKLHPGAAAVYAADRAWWQANIKDVDAKVSEHTRLFCADQYCCRSFGLEFRAVHCEGGLSLDHFVLKAGGTIGNSGAQAINLAYLAGARRIVLVGFDMARLRNREHWFGDHPSGVHRQSPYPTFVRGMGDMARDLDREGVEVINASRESTLPYWPKVAPADLETL